MACHVPMPANSCSVTLGEADANSWPSLSSRLSPSLVVDDDCCGEFIVVLVVEEKYIASTKNFDTKPMLLRDGRANVWQQHMELALVSSCMSLHFFGGR